MSDHSEYVSIVDNPYVNLEGFDKSICCRSLMLNALKEWYCNAHSESLGYAEDGTMKAMMYCRFYNRDGNCFIEISKKAAREKERAEREKAEQAEKALFKKSIADFSDIIKTNPNDAKTYFLRGGSYAQLKEFKQAIDDFNEAIRLNSDYAEAYAHRGMVYCQRDDGQADNNLGIADLNEAIRLNSDCKNAYWFRAAIYGAQGEHDKSISDYEEALRIAPNDSTTKSLLENAKKLKKEAEQKHLRGISQNQRDAEAYEDSFEVAKAKKEIKRVNICSIIFGILGIALGIFILIEDGGFSNSSALAGFILSIWFGIGLGSGFVSLFECLSIFPRAIKEEGFTEACKLALGGGVIFFALFTLAGPLGWLIKVIKGKNIIRKFKYLKKAD